MKMKKYGNLRDIWIGGARGTLSRRGFGGLTYWRNKGMKRKIVSGLFAVSISLTTFVLPTAPEAAENFARGTLVVDGQSVDITQVYAYAQPGFFDKKKQDVVVLLCDAPVPAPAVR